ncbi:MAG: hypothetical protein ACLRQF_12815 [Thomasclavelia ramosa]
MVQVGNDSKCRFVWTAHPFMGGFNASKVDEEIASLLKSSSIVRCWGTPIWCSW